MSFYCLSCIYCEVFSDEVAMESCTEPLCGRLWLLLSSQPDKYHSTMKGSPKLSPWGVFGEKDIFRLFSRTQTLEILERIRTRHCQNVDLSDLLHSNGDLSDAFSLLEIYEFVWDAWVQCRTLPHSVCEVSKSFKYSWTWKVRTIQGSIVFVKTALVGNFKGGSKPQELKWKYKFSTSPPQSATLCWLVLRPV